MLRIRARGRWAAALGALPALLVATCVFDDEAPFRCENGVKDGDEIGVDCGGSCAPCGDAGGGGGVADAGHDAHADASGDASTCGDGHKDGDETDVDCGGLCGPCGRGLACVADADCAPLLCVNGACGFTPLPIWVPINSTSLPAKRYGAAMAPAPEGGLLLYGGHFPGTADAITWKLVGEQWSKANTSGPSARYAPAMALDSGATPKTVLYGGDASQTYSEVYTWTGSGWAADTAPSSARFYMAMAYDPVGKQIVVFGGISAGIAPLADLLFRASATGKWTGPVAPNGTAPSAKYGVASAFDGDRDRLVIFGGDDGAAGTSQTWELDPVLRQFPAAAKLTTGPSARTDATMAYDPERRVIVLFGGRDSGTTSSNYSANGETWEYRFDAAAGKGKWQQITVTDGPTKRFRAAMAFDKAGHRVVMFGGTNILSGGYQDTWAYTTVGGPCAAPTDCGTGSCQDGLCCEHDCTAGQRCDTLGSPGRCTTLPP